MYFLVALYLVWEHGLDNLPYYHKHTDTSDGWEYALVQLVDFERDASKAYNVSLLLVDWKLEERQDIGV